MSTPIGLLLSHKGSAVYSVVATATVAEAVRVMNSYKIGAVLVIHAGKLAGIFTERDVLMRVVAAGRMPHMTVVDDVMTRRPATISPHASMEEAMELFTMRRCRHLPVVEEGEELVGVISIGDVTRWLVEEHRHEANHLRQYIEGESYR